MVIEKRDINWRGVDEVEYRFFCPGCKTLHFVNNTWNVDLATNTISPSVRVSGGRDGKTLCHSFVRNGEIQFLDDSIHELRGKTIKLPDVEAKDIK